MLLIKNNWKTILTSSHESKTIEKAVTLERQRSFTITTFLLYDDLFDGKLINVDWIVLENVNHSMITSYISHTYLYTPLLWWNHNRKFYFISPWLYKLMLFSTTEYKLNWRQWTEDYQLLNHVNKWQSYNKARTF